MALDFPGTGSGPMLPSGDPALPDDLAGSYAVDLLADKLTGAQRDALMNGKVEAKVADMIEGMLTSVATMVLTAVAKMEGGDAVVRDFQSLLGAFSGSGSAASGSDPTSAPRALGAAPVSRSDADQAPASAPSAPEDEPSGPKHLGEDPSQRFYHPKQAYQEGLEKGKAMTMGSIAKSIAAPVAQNMSERQSWFPVTLDDGTEVLRKINPHTGETLSQLGVDDPGFAQQAAKVRLATGARTMLSGAAAGEGIAGTLGATAARVAGPIGLAIGAAQMGGGFLEKQQTAAQPFKAAFGEETSMLAGKERAGAWLAGLSGFGSIGTEEARAQYMRATAMGLDGERRTEATQFMGGMQRRFGLDTDTSAGMVEQVTKQGNVALDDFADAITNVSRAAVAAGRSSKEAIESFAATQAIVAKNITTGPASIEISEGIATMAAENLDQGLATSLGGAEGIAGMLSGSNVMAMATLNGQDPMEAMWAMSNPTTAAAQVNKTLADIGEFVTGEVAKVLGLTKDALKKAIAAETGGKTVSPDEQHRIFEAIAGGPQQAGTVVSLVMPALNSFLGKPVDSAQMLNYLFAAASGAFAGPEPTILSKIGDTLASASESSPTGSGDMGYEKIDGSQAAGRGSYIDTGPTLGDKQQQEILKNLGYGSTGYTGGENPMASDDAVAAYIEYVASTGQGDASIESLLSSKNRSGILAAGDAKAMEDVQFRVKTDTGRQDMDLATLLEKGYADQIRSGQAEVVGQNEGDLPTSLASLGVIGLSPEAREMFRMEQGPTPEQKEGVPPGSTRATTRYPSYGKRP